MLQNTTAAALVDVQPVSFDTIPGSISTGDACALDIANQARIATDGLHPNALGEYQIAYAFAETLQGKLNIGTRPLIVPPEGDPALVRDLQIPSNFTVSSSDDGITALWDPGQFEQATESSSRRISTVLTSRTVYGAYGYDLKVSVDEGRNGLFELTTEVNRWDSQSTMDEGQYSVSVRATGGDVIKGEWTSTKTARAQPSRVFHPTETN